MKRIPLALLLLCLLAPQVHAQSVMVLATCQRGATLASTPISAVFGASGNIKIINGVTAQYVKIVQWVLESTADVGIQFTEGTGTTCQTGTTNVTGVIHPFTTLSRPVDSGPPQNAMIITNTAADNLCLNASAAATITGWTISCTE